MGRLNHHALIWGAFLTGLAFRAWGIPAQPPLDDEVAAAFSAANYLEHGLFGQVMWYHPPLRNFVVHLSGELFGGYSAWGLRGGSILLGALTVPLLGYSVFFLLGSVSAAGLASLFLALDPLHIALSRQAFQESTTPFFFMAGVLATVLALRRDRAWLCYLSGLCFALSTAAKWHGLFPWALSAVAYLAAPWLRGDGKARLPVERILTTAAAYLVLPICVYVAAYLPWMLRGYSLPEFLDLQAWLLKRQVNHKALGYDETIQPHRAWRWFLWPEGYASFVFAEGRGYLNIAMGNILVWILTLPSLYFATREWLRKRDFGLGFCLSLFLISYLPLVLTTRGIWVFSAPAVIPFAFILSAWAISELMGRHRIERRHLAAYLAAVFLVTLLLYPMSISRTLEHGYLKPVADLYSPHRGEGLPAGEGH